MTIEECKTLCGLIADGSPSQKFTDGTYKSWHMIIGNLPYVHTFKAWVALRRHEAASITIQLENTAAA